MLINQLPFLFSILMSSMFYVLTIDYTEIKPGQYPYVMFFDASVNLLNTKVIGVGILLSDRTIMTDAVTGKDVRKMPTFAYSGFSGKSNATNLSLRYPIKEVKILFYEAAYDLLGRPFVLNYSISLVILKDPVIFEDGFYPIKIPFYQALDEIDIVHVGISVRTGNLYHSKLNVKKWQTCVQKYAIHNHLAPPNFFQANRYRAMLCSNLLPPINGDVVIQGPFIKKGETPKDDLLIGIYSFDYYLKNASRIAIGPNVVLLRSLIILNSDKSLQQ